MNETLLYNIAITCIPNIGDITAKKLIAYCGSSEQVFKEKKQILAKVPGIGEINAQNIIQNTSFALDLAEHELNFIRKNNIKPLFFLDDNYPKRLVHCEDGPVIFYTKGNTNFNQQKVISIVGTRKSTDYGIEFCEQLIKELTAHQPLIISGLAFGVDICAHKAALQNNLQTVGIVAHGLDRLYPKAHQSTANKMLQNGGLATEFKSGTNPDRENFPKRNRIVAGLSDLTIVIESSKKGGSLITAGLANDYNRDVFALPGRIHDKQSEGCNTLIKSNKAHLIQSAKDIEYIMSWEAAKKTQPRQAQLFSELSKEEKMLTNTMIGKGKMAIDNIALEAKFPMSKTASLLLELEFNGVVKSLPGKMYKLV